MGLRSSCFLSRSRIAIVRRLGCCAITGLGLLSAGAAIFAVTRIPAWVEHRLKTSFASNGFQQADLKVTRAAWRELELTALHLIRPGWSARVDKALIRYRPLAYLSHDYESLELHGLEADIDLEELVRSGRIRLPSSLLELHRDSRYRLIRFHHSRFHLRRGESREEIDISGDFRTQGPVALEISGRGISPFTLGLHGKAAGERGDATLHGTLKSDNLAGLLEEFAPGWLQKNPVYSMGGVELKASLQMVADRPLVTDAGGIIHWKGWQFDNGRVEPSRIHLQKKGDAVALESDTLQLRRDDGLAARGFIEATFAPEGSAEDTPFLQGRLHVTSWSSPEVDLKPFLVPFAGTPANLRLGPAQLAFPGDRSLRELWVRLENPPSSPLRAEGKALLELPLVPLLKPSAQQPVLLRLPATGRYQGPKGNRALEFTIHGEDVQGNPLRIDLGGYLAEFRATLTGTLPPGPSPRKIPLHLDAPQVDLGSADRALLRITALDLSGSAQDGLVEATGKGLWEGEPFSLKLSQTASRAPTPGGRPVTTAVSLGPVPLRSAVWPGNLVKAWRGTRSSGELMISGTLVQISPSAPPRPDLALHFRNGSLTYPDNSATAEGVQAKVQIASLEPFLAPAISVAVDRISAGKVELSQVRLAAALTGPDQVRIESFDANLLGGSIRLAEPVVMAPDGPAFKVMFDLSRIQGAEAIRLFPQFKGSVEASIGGRVPLMVENGKIQFLQGHLFLDGAGPAHLSYSMSGFLTNGKLEGRPQTKFSQSVERALGNLTIQSLDVRLFDPADPSHPAIVKLAGIGISNNLNLPVNLTIPVEDKEGILQSLFARILSAGMNVLRPQ